MLVTVNINPGFVTGQYKHHKDVHHIYNGKKAYIEFPRSMFHLIQKVLFNQEVRKLKCKSKIIYYANSRSFFGIMRDFVIIMRLKNSHDKIILHNHGSDQLFFSKFSPTNLMYNFLIMKADSIIFLNSFTVPEHNFLSKRIANKATVIHNYCSAFSRKVLINNDKTILYVSNFILEKGYKRVIDFAIQNESHLRSLGWKIKMIGNFIDGTQELHLKSLESVTLNIVGPLSSNDVFYELSQAKVLVFPSTYKTECQPLAVLEAVAHGCVVYSSEINNFLEGFECLGVQSFRSIDKMFSELMIALERNSILPREGYDLAAASTKFSKQAFLSKFSLLL